MGEVENAKAAPIPPKVTSKPSPVKTLPEMAPTKAREMKKPVVPKVRPIPKGAYGENKAWCIKPHAACTPCQNLKTGNPNCRKCGGAGWTGTFVSQMRYSGARRCTFVRLGDRVFVQDPILNISRSANSG